MTSIRFDSGIIVTIRDGFVEAPSATLAALLNVLAASLPQFAADADIARGIIEERRRRCEIVRRDPIASAAPRDPQIRDCAPGGEPGKIVGMFDNFPSTVLGRQLCYTE